ncbi:MAG: hypothetical protein GXP32_05995, partial [Kiritimatiellaeota bacterium]|nr:hypothetical protein [Kiritimatiellota bacterium]
MISLFSHLRAESLKKVISPNEIQRSPAPIRKTSFFTSLNSWVDRFSAGKYNGVICFTDGIDTSGDSIDTAVAKLEKSSIPHLFIPITTKLRTLPYAKFARLESATSAKAGSEVPVTSIISFSGLDSSEKLNLTVTENNETRIYSSDIPVKSPATQSKTVKFSVPLHDPGTHQFKALLSSAGKVLSKVEWSIQCVRKERTRILLYQGGLDWGTRFFRTVAALEKEDFSLDVRFAPGSFGPKKVNIKGLNAPFPSFDELEKYNIVIILKMRKKQISSKIEEDLRRYIRNGGALLFIIANTVNAADYAKSPLEKLLPVIFESDLGNPAKFDKNTAAFIAKMKKYRATKARTGPYKHEYNSALNYSVKVPPLTEMKLTREGEISPIFNYLNPGKTNDKSELKLSLPRFQDFALVVKEKPGASVLAVHPFFKNKNKNRILIAVQQYGLGKSAVLATDPLWRWKLSLKSTDQSYRQFWRQFLGWLTAGAKSGPYWVLANSLIDTGKPSRFLFKIPSVSDMKFKDMKFRIEDISRETLTPLSLSQDSPREFSVKFTPKHESSYRLVAEKNGETVAEALFSSSPNKASKELDLLNPAIETLETLSETSCAEMVSTSENFNLKNWIFSGAENT